MCGLACILGDSKGLNWNTEELLSILNNRGPDASGDVEGEWFRAIHTRLSIIDVDSRANQPMWDQTKRYCLVFNGEIYNYRELRKGLNGVESFQTQSDSEVLLQLLIQKGKHALNELNGCFSFCFIDTEQEYALVVRDRFGINPLYYSIAGDRLICSSSFKAIAIILGSMEPSQPNVHRLMQFSFCAAPDSLDGRIAKLLPGNCIEYSEGEISESSWYHPKPANPSQDLKALLEESVARRLISDVPVGTFLSGGLDSSLISALAAKVHPGITAFSIGFENDYIDESKWAKLMASKINVNHQLLVISEKDMLRDFDAYLDDLDEPFGDSSSLAMWSLARMASKEVKVCLSGDGADELFGGYNRHQAFWHWNSKGIKSRVANFVGKRIGSGSRESNAGNWRRKLSSFATLSEVERKDIYERLCSFSEKDLTSTIYGKASEFPFCIESEGGDALQEYLKLDQSFILPNDMLHKVDVMSMAHSLEVRTPFLDHNMVEWVNAQDVKQKFSGSATKIMLREAAKGIVPDEIINRGKSGFEIPVESWLRGPLEDYLFQGIGVIEERLSWVNIKKLREARLQFSAGDSQFASMMWNTMILGQWLARHSATRESI